MNELLSNTKHISVLYSSMQILLLLRCKLANWGSEKFTVFIGRKFLLCFTVWFDLSVCLCTHVCKYMWMCGFMDVHVSGKTRGQPLVSFLRYCPPWFLRQGPIRLNWSIWLSWLEGRPGTCLLLLHQHCHSKCAPPHSASNVSSQDWTQVLTLMKQDFQTELSP